jgi:hypothetical protein
VHGGCAAGGARAADERQRPIMKTIGLLGGMSWQSSIEYERIINDTPAGAMVALLSDIAFWVLVIAVAPTAAFTCSGLSSNPLNSRSTRGEELSLGWSSVWAALCVPAPGDQNAGHDSAQCDYWLAHAFPCRGRI